MMGPNTTEISGPSVSRHDSTGDACVCLGRGMDKRGGLMQKNVAEGEGPPATKQLFTALRQIAQE